MVFIGKSSPNDRKIQVGVRKRSGVAARFRLVKYQKLPSGKRLHSYGKSPFLMGKSTISMAISHCYVSLPEGTQNDDF